jgi:hypothetical protein
MNIYKQQFVPLVGFSFILATALVWRTVKDKLSVAELGVAILASILLYVLLVSLWTWYHMKPKETLAENRRAYEDLYRTIRNGYEEQYLKIKATVDKLIQKQRFIDQSILNVIESEADEIWVITTKLANELANMDLQRAVAKNLSEGKRYIYFLPDPTDVHFGRIDRNLTAFKQLDLYKNYKGQVEFIRLPLDTQFLLDEVVIYNPDKPEMPHDPAHGINGFTYYESNDDPDAEGPLHMKIEGHLLGFLSERLSIVLRNTGLKAAAERVLTEFEDSLGDADKLYLVGLLSRRTIANKDAYADFMRGVAVRTGSDRGPKFIDQLLSKYVET